MNLLWLGNNAKQGVDALRIHDQLSPPRTLIEPPFPQVQQFGFMYFTLFQATKYYKFSMKNAVFCLLIYFEVSMRQIGFTLNLHHKI